jgi:hypothetical protein
MLTCSIKKNNIKNIDGLPSFGSSKKEEGMINIDGAHKKKVSIQS